MRTTDYPAFNLEVQHPCAYKKTAIPSMMELLNTSSTRSNAVMMKYITATGNCYTHFSREEREEIAIGLERGESIRRIAKKPGGSPSSVSREIRRNTPLFRLVRYRGNRAHQRAAARSRRSHARRRPDTTRNRGQTSLRPSGTVNQLRVYLSMDI